MIGMRIHSHDTKLKNSSKKIQESQEMVNEMCRNAASTNTEQGKFSQVLNLPAEVVYHTSSLAGYQRPFGRHFL